MNWPRTPRRARVVVGLAALLFLTAPCATAFRYGRSYFRGEYLADADSIAIPVAAFVVALVVTAPLTWGFVWLCIRRYPGSASIVAWNAERPCWSFAWTSFVTVAATPFLYELGWSVADRQPEFGAHCAVDLWMLLILRSAIVTQPKPAPKS